MPGMEYHHLEPCPDGVLVWLHMQCNANAFIHTYRTYFVIFRDFLQLGRIASRCRADPVKTA